MIKRLLRILGIQMFTLSVIAIIAFYWYDTVLRKPITVNKQAVQFAIKPGENIKTVSLALKEQGIISQPAGLVQLYVRISGQDTQIKAGEYLIEPETSLPSLIAQFVDGKVILHAFTIVEGFTSKQLLETLAQNAHISHILTGTGSEELLRVLELHESHPEGLFLPDTYHFPAGTTDVEFLQRAYQQLQNLLNTAWEQRANNLPYNTPYEALIMASIIEKETAVADERPLIAGVFVRRMQKGMRLQTDPTVIYGLGDKFDGNLRLKDLKTDTPYNTYTRFGLPPTPICLPSREAIEAALHPADGNSLYFVATGEGGRHVFSTNLQDHNKAVQRYQLKQ